MIEIRKAAQSDIDYCCQNPIEESIKSYPALTLKDYALTGLVDGKIIGTGGVVILWESVGEGWIILTKDVNEYKTEAILCIRKLMNQAIKELKLRRLQMIARTDFPKAQKLAKTLGFQCEGCMKNYLPDGSDCFLYARVI